MSPTPVSVFPENRPLRYFSCPFCTVYNPGEPVLTGMQWSAGMPNGEIVGEVDVVFSIKPMAMVLTEVKRPDGRLLLQISHKCSMFQK